VIGYGLGGGGGGHLNSSEPQNTNILFNHLCIMKSRSHGVTVYNVSVMREDLWTQFYYNLEVLRKIHRRNTSYLSARGYISRVIDFSCKTLNRMLPQLIFC